MRALRIGLGQINTTVGDIAGNVRRIVLAAEAAREHNIDLLVLPELALTGYPPEDLLLKPSFAAASTQALSDLAPQVQGLWAIIGFVDLEIDLYNAAALVGDGYVQAIYHKRYLPNYGVFDEDRYFRPGNECPLYVFNDVRVGVTICEDIWYATGPAAWQAAAGADVLVNLSASPYHARKGVLRERMLSVRASDTGSFLCYANLIGGQDELIFDGQSLVIGPTGQIVARGRPFAEDLLVVDLDLDAVLRTRLHDPRPRKLEVDTYVGPNVRHQEDGSAANAVRRVLFPINLLASAERPRLEQSSIVLDTSGRAPFGAQRREEMVTLAAQARAANPQSDEEAELVEEVYAALVLGTHDYVTKNGFQGAIIGLSGGIDSSLVAAIAVDALGAERVHGVAMPSNYNASSSEEDACQLSKALGIDFQVIAIQPIFEAFLAALEPSFRGTPTNVAEENIQARIRGSLWMALANKFSEWLPLTAGNKSEMATGYATLYGDMAGGFAVLKDVPKTLVYKLARYRNSLGAAAVIPARVLTKAPSAELRPNQKDTDSLPDYDALDRILEAYVEEDWDFAHLIAEGHDPATVSKVIRLVDRAEYKRRQAAPGIKITPRAFGRDRRLPITNRFMEAAAQEQ